MSDVLTFAGKRIPLPQQLAHLPQDASVLLAFSGGADSGALLHLLAEAAREKGFSLLLAHVNHGIRGEEALRDRAFCEEAAARYGLELCVLDADVPRLAAESGRGLEEEARRVRYAFFEDLMRARKIPLLATAHHADDHLETVLFRVARGSGLRGLCGIAPVRPFADGFLTRPLLALSRREILQYCKEMGLEYVTDSTNTDVSYARNRIRAEAVPALEALFEDPQGRAVRMSRSLREDEDFLQETARAFLDQRSGQSLFAADLRQLHPAIRKRVLTAWMAEFSERSAETVHLEELSARIAEGCESGAFSVPGGRILIERGELRFSALLRDGAEPFRFPFREGELTLPASGIRIRAVRVDETDETKINNLSIARRINGNCFFAIIGKTLYWRSRQEGDRIRRGGMHRRLRKLCNEKGIPPRLREQMPLLCDEEGILWAPYIGARDGALIFEKYPSGEDGSRFAEGEKYFIEVLFPDAPEGMR